MLDLFISWSGALSREVAGVFYQWFPELLPNTKPWMSNEDIPKGKPWFSSILSQLGKSPVCIICVTEQNVHSSWIYYEAGGISFAMNDPHICPYLVNAQQSELAATPLGQFQCTRFDKADTWRLVRDINRQLDTPHDENLLQSHFNQKWPLIKKKIDRLIEEYQVAPAEELEEDTEALSPEAFLLLKEASRDGSGRIMHTHWMGGFSVTAGSKTLFEGDDQRKDAEFAEALEELEAADLVECRSSKREGFRLKNKGFKLGDALLAKEKSVEVGPAKPELTDLDILALLQGWLGNLPSNASTSAIKFADVDKELDLPPGSAKRLLPEAGKMYNFVPLTKGENVIIFKCVSSASSRPLYLPPN